MERLSPIVFCRLGGRSGLYFRPLSIEEPVLDILACLVSSPGIGMGWDGM